MPLPATLPFELGDVPTPAERMVLVPADQRVMVVMAEHRVTVVASDPPYEGLT